MQLLHNVITCCLHVKDSYVFQLFCVPCQEITQECTQLLLRNNYVFKKKNNSTFKIEALLFFCICVKYLALFTFSDVPEVLKF